MGESYGEMPDIGNKAPSALFSNTGYFTGFPIISANLARLFISERFESLSKLRMCSELANFLHFLTSPSYNKSVEDKLSDSSKSEFAVSRSLNACS